MRRFVCLPIGISIAVAAATCFVGCRDMNPPSPRTPGSTPVSGVEGSGEPLWSSNPNAVNSRRPPKPLLPEVRPQGPIGPLVTTLAALQPATNVPGLPVMMAGGDLLVVNADTRKLFAVPTACENWDRTGKQYGLAVAPVEYHVTLTAERVRLASAAHAEPTFTVIFETAPGRGGWHGPMLPLTSRLFFQLPDGHSPEAITALATEDASPMTNATGGTRFVYTLGKTVVVGDVRETPESVDLGAAFHAVAELPEPPLALAFAKGEIFVALPKHQILILRESANFNVDKAEKIQLPAAMQDESVGEISRIDVLSAASESAAARLFVHTTSGAAWVDNQIYIGPIAMLPRGFVARFAAGSVEILDAKSRVRAKIGGFPTTVDYFMADPLGKSIAAISGREFIAAALNLDHPAYGDAGE